MAYETLLYEVGDDRVATITINRPERMNSWTNQMCAEFARLWGEIKLDARVHAVVLRASGDRAFSTGVDVKEEFFQPANIWNHSDGARTSAPSRTSAGSRWSAPCTAWPRAARSTGSTRPTS